MKTIQLENYASQIGNVPTASDTIVVDQATGKRYNHNGVQWVEYTGFAVGGNIVLTSLVASLPKVSIADAQVIGSPYILEPIDNMCMLNGTVTIPTANYTYGRTFMAGYTGNLTAIKIFNGATVAGNVQIGIYNSAGTLLGKTTTTACIAGFQTIAITLSPSNTAQSNVPLTGGNAYIVAYSFTSTANTMNGFTALPTASIAPIAMQWYSASIIPNTLTANGSNISTCPYIGLVVS
jgi:hypothetical protein